MPPTDREIRELTLAVEQSNDLLARLVEIQEALYAQEERYEKPVYSVRETAQLANVSPHTVRRYIREGRINAVKRGRTQQAQYVVPKEEVMKLVNDRGRRAGIG